MMNKSNLTKDNLVELIGELRHNIVNLNDSIEVIEKISNNFSIIHSNLYSFVESLEDEEAAQEEEPPEDTLRVGDYISLPSDAHGFDYDLFQIIDVGINHDIKYTCLDIERLNTWDITFDSIEDLIKELPEDAYVYKVCDGNRPVKDGNRYLIYDADNGGDYEVRIEYDDMEDVFKVKLATCEDYLIDKVFYSLDELNSELKSTYSIIKQLRD